MDHPGLQHNSVPEHDPSLLHSVPLIRDTPGNHIRDTPGNHIRWHLADRSRTYSLATRLVRHQLFHLLIASRRRSCRGLFACHLLCAAQPNHPSQPGTLHLQSDPLQTILDPALQHHDYTTHHVPTAWTGTAFDPFFPVSINSTIPLALSLATIAHPLFPAPEPCPTLATNTLSTAATIYMDDLGFQWAWPTIS